MAGVAPSSFSRHRASLIDQKALDNLFATDVTYENPLLLDPYIQIKKWSKQCRKPLVQPHRPFAVPAVPRLVWQVHNAPVTYGLPAIRSRDDRPFVSFQSIESIGGPTRCLSTTSRVRVSGTQRGQIHISTLWSQYTWISWVSSVHTLDLVKRWRAEEGGECVPRSRRIGWWESQRASLTIWLTSSAPLVTTGKVEWRGQERLCPCVRETKIGTSFGAPK